jgi:hypothetical protein
MEKTGWINIHIDMRSHQMYCSQKPYKTRKEAKSAIFMGVGIKQVKTVKIKW